MRRFVLCLFASCLEPTEVDVRITTDLKCAGVPSDIDEPHLLRTDITMLRPGGDFVTQTHACSEGKIGHIVFTGGPSNEVRFRVRGVLDWPGHEGIDITAERIVKFIPHRALSLDVNLDAACAGVRCADGATCEQGECVSSATTCTDKSCAPAEAGPPDADIPDSDVGDGGTTSSCPLVPANGWFRWRLDEAMPPVVEEYSKTTSGLPQVGATLTPMGRCGGYLSIAQTTMPVVLFGTKSWVTHTFTVSFWVFPGTSGGVALARGDSSKAGGWRFDLAPNGVSFTMHGDLAAQTASASIKPGQWSHVLGHAKAGQKVTLSINGGAPAMSSGAIVTMSTTQQADVVLGTNASYGIDEIVMGP